MQNGTILFCNIYVITSLPLVFEKENVTLENNLIANFARLIVIYKHHSNFKNGSKTCEIVINFDMIRTYSQRHHTVSQSLVKWSSVCLQIKWLWVQVSLQSLIKL